MAKRKRADADETPRRLPTPDWRIVALVGPDEFLAAETVPFVRELLTDRFGEVETVRYDGASATPADVLDECNSVSLMPVHKLVVVDDAQELVREANRPIFERYAQRPSPDATLVLRFRGAWQPGNLGKLIDAVGGISRCDPPENAGKAASWAIRRALKRLSATLAPAAARALVERVGLDCGRLNSELGRLAAVAGGREPVITVELVEEHVSSSRGEDVWPLQDLLINRDAAGAIRFMRYLRATAPKDSAWAIMSIPGDAARKLHACVQGAAHRASPDAIAGALGIFPEERRAFYADAARRFTPAQAAAVLHDAVRAEAASKSGVGEQHRNAEVAAVCFAIR